MRSRRWKQLSRIKKFRLGKNEKTQKEKKEEEKKERQESKEVVPDKTMKLIKGAAISNVISDKEKMIDTSIKR